jgi:dephospho-CoA kinase
MPILVALAGLSGAGKTTAADYFSAAGLAERLYVGEEVLNEIRAQGLPGGPDTERKGSDRITRTVRTGRLCRSSGVAHQSPPASGSKCGR